MVAGRHEDDCPGGECPGCEPCTEPHCLVQWHGERGDCETHAVSVCPSCLGKVREHLGEIVRLSGLPLVDQVLSAGDVDCEAADLLGPAAMPAQWRQRGNYGHIYHPDSRVGELHPLWVLGTWDLLVTEHLGHTRTAKVTVDRAADYLGRNLTWLAADLEFDFAVMADELANCRSHLEAVLHDGEQVDRGAPCMSCGKSLERTWGTSSDKDGWRCPRCRESSTEDQYRFAVMHLHREEAAWLTDLDMEIRTGIKAATVRSWARSEFVRKRRDSGRTVYAVDDVMSTARDKGLVA